VLLTNAYYYYQNRYVLDHVLNI